MADRGSGQAPDPKIPVSSPHPTCSSSTMTGTQRAPRFEASLPPPRKLCLCPEVWSAAQQDSQTSSWERSPSLPRPCFPHPCEIGLTPSDHSCLERGFLRPRGPGLVHSGLPPGHLLQSSHCSPATAPAPSSSTCSCPRAGCMIWVVPVKGRKRVSLKGLGYKLFYSFAVSLCLSIFFTHLPLNPMWYFLFTTQWCSLGHREPGGGTTPSPGTLPTTQPPCAHQVPGSPTRRLPARHSRPCARTADLVSHLPRLPPPTAGP